MSAVLWGEESSLIEGVKEVAVDADEEVSWHADALDIEACASSDEDPEGGEEDGEAASSLDDGGE